MISKEIAARRVLNKTQHASWALREVSRVMSLEISSMKAMAYALHVLWCQCNTGWWVYAGTTVRWQNENSEKKPPYTARLLMRSKLNKIKHSTIIKNIRVLEDVTKNN